jgi:glycosyltransferase involved in cell wall biosynthesis
MPRVLAALDVFTLTSLVEGCPNVVGEAMACGVPCVVTQSAGDGPAMVGDTGRVIPSRDPPALTEAWVDCLSLKADERTKLAASARARAEACYSLDAMRGRYRTLYARIQEGSA